MLYCCVGYVKVCFCCCVGYAGYALPVEEVLSISQTVLARVFTSKLCFKAAMNPKIFSALQKQNQKTQIHPSAEHKPVVETTGKQSLWSEGREDLYK